MAAWTSEDGRKALATVSTLKRALGIPNHPTEKDKFVNESIHIFTPEESSAILIGELLYRYGNGPREKFYNARPDLRTNRDTVCVQALPEGGYDASMFISYAPSFTKALEKMVLKHIAPDKKLSR
jgi:hypothetical protein